MISKIKRRLRERELQKIRLDDTRINISLDDFFKYQERKMFRVYEQSRLVKPDSSLELIQSLRYVDNMTAIVINCAEDFETAFNIASVTILPGARMNDSMNLLEKSIVLALSGGYTAAHSLLRVAYESLIVGGFYHVVAFNPKEMISDISSYNGHGKYPRPFGVMVEDILKNLTTEERRFLSLSLEKKIENIFGNHEPKLIPPPFSLMLSQVCEFYRLITPKYKKKTREMYDNLSVHIHAMKDASYDIRNWKEGIVFSAEKLQSFQSSFLYTLDMIGYLYNVIMAGSYSWEDVALNTLQYIKRFEVEGQKMTLTNSIVENLCNLTISQKRETDVDS